MGIQSGNNYMVKNAVVLKVNFEDLDKRSKTPILTYCRKLLNDGFAPELKLHVYRENQEDPDVIVNSIGEASKYTVKETTEVGPVFAKIDSRYKDGSYPQFNKLEVPTSEVKIS
jgi:hypothetical protein